MCSALPATMHSTKGPPPSLINPPFKGSLASEKDSVYLWKSASVICQRERGHQGE